MLLILLLLPAISSMAQAPKEIPPPTNVKVIEEHKDNKGNTVRTIEYYQAGKRMVETMVIPPRSNVNLRFPIKADTLNKDSVLIIVTKSKYCLEVYYRRKLVRYYKAVFGPKPMENKKMEGDRCTPEGWFSIKSKNPNSRYNKCLIINYPNDSCLVCFNRLKANGGIPKTAGIGGNVGIHGIWKGGDDMIESGVCWTDGCVAIKNKDIDELYTFTEVGTRVYIKK